MASLAQSGPGFDPWELLAVTYGFVPNLFRALAELPAALLAEAGLMDATILTSPHLSKTEKKKILSIVGQACENQYVAALHQHDTTDEIHPTIVTFARKLARYGPCLSKQDVDSLRAGGMDDRVVFEIVATVALGNMFSVLAKALHPALDHELEAELPGVVPSTGGRWNDDFGPYLNTSASVPGDLASLLRDQYGFVPGVFRCQASWPELLAAEIKALQLLVFGDDHLSRIQKESILLAVSVANLNTYGVALHSQILAVLGMSSESIDAIIHASENPPLAKGDQVLLSQISQLLARTSRDNATFDQNILANAGYSQPQILEAIATASLGEFFNTLAVGLGVPPDFPPKRVFTEKDLYPEENLTRRTLDAAVCSDPDAELVARVQAGETEVFEKLVRQHTRQVFGTLNGMLANYEEARDATQDVFIKAFEHIGKFEGRAKFSTWVTSIAVNTGTEILRRRRTVVPLEDAEDEHFRPRRVTAWAENPEALFAASQITSLVREAVLRLPYKYRVAVLLRDINQLPTEDAAEALGLSVPALKARVLRGRLMLRESLAIHFVSTGNTDA
jgi:RNA polymerase sigma-70 factor, ECF subfamily